MEYESNFVISLQLYIEETRQRMADMICNLLATQYDCPAQTDCLLQQLRMQTEASRRAGYECIVQLCQSMEDCLIRIGSHIDKQRLETAISTLMEACEAISRHADLITGISTRCKNAKMCG